MIRTIFVLELELEIPPVAHLPNFLPFPLSDSSRTFLLPEQRFPVPNLRKRSLN